MTQPITHTLWATLAGTASSQPHALWQQWSQLQTANLATEAAQAPAPIALTHWTAPTAAHLQDSDMPTGLVFWLPTPADASAAEHAEEIACRQQLVHATMNGRTSLRVLYGPPAQQLRALQECLQVLLHTLLQDTRHVPNALPAIAPETAAVSASPVAALAAAHGHAAGLRCRECVDPASEQRLFSSLLARAASTQAPKG